MPRCALYAKKSPSKMPLHPAAKAIKRVMPTKIGMKNVTEKMASVKMKKVKKVMRVRRKVKMMKEATKMKRGEGLRRLRSNSSCDQSTHLLV